MENFDKTNNSLQLSVIGITHKTARLEDRELFYISRKEIQPALKYLHSFDGVEGIVIVVTCNRIEFYFVTTPNVDSFHFIEQYYRHYKNVDLGLFRNNFFKYRDQEATKHLFEVVSGLDSLILGEYQILGQVKEAYSLACQAQTVDKILHKLFHASFRCGKKVRSTTKFGEGKQSISGVAFQIIKDYIKPNELITIVGVNENTKIIASDLYSANYNNLLFLNRTLYKAEQLAEQYGGRAGSLTELERALFDSKAVFSSTSAPGYIVTKEMMRKLYVQERYPKLIIDIAIPRDIDTTEHPTDMEVFDLAKIQLFLDRQKSMLEAEIPAVKHIIELETELFQSWSESKDNEALEPYAEKFEAIRQQLLEEVRNNFNQADFEKVDKLSKKLLHRIQAAVVNIQKANKSN